MQQFTLVRNGVTYSANLDEYNPDDNRVVLFANKRTATEWNTRNVPGQGYTLQPVDVKPGTFYRLKLATYPFQALTMNGDTLVNIAPKYWFEITNL